jgi:von Willebrand factor type A C-terminal domain
MLAGRAGMAVAERLGMAPVTFPGGHDGFLGGEYGGMGEPDAFAITLRQVLTGLPAARATGTVRLKAKVADADRMALDTRSAKTVRVKKLRSVPQYP